MIYKLIFDRSGTPILMQNESPTRPAAEWVEETVRELENNLTALYSYYEAIKEKEG